MDRVEANQPDKWRGNLAALVYTISCATVDEIAVVFCSVVTSSLEGV